MGKRKQFNSVSDMVHAIADDKEFADSVECHIASRSLLKQMMAMRAARNLSQKDIAESLGCSQSKLSKLENGTDDDLRIGDLGQYMEALGMELRLVISEQKETIVDEVKYHVFRIKDLMDQLASLAQGDERIARGVTGFFNEAFFNLIRMLQDSAQKLPDHPDAPCPRIQIEVQEVSSGPSEESSSTDHGCELCGSH